MRRIIAALVLAVTATVGTRARRRARTRPTRPRRPTSRIASTSCATSRGLGGVTTHSVLTAKAEAWAQHMADTGCLCHSNLPDGVTVGWRKLGENIGRGPSVTSIHDALVNSPPHYANMVDAAFRWIGVGVAYGNGQMYVAEVFMDGDRRRPARTRCSHSTPPGAAIAARAQGGFWVLAGQRHRSRLRRRSRLRLTQLPRRLRSRHRRMPDGNGYVILDALRRRAPLRLRAVHPGRGRRPVVRLRHRPQHRRRPRTARASRCSTASAAYHRFGSAPQVGGLPYWTGWDIARSIAFRPGGGVYMLDGFGARLGSGRCAQLRQPVLRLEHRPGHHGLARRQGLRGHRRLRRAPPVRIRARLRARPPYQPIDRWRSRRSCSPAPFLARSERRLPVGQAGRRPDDQLAGVVAGEEPVERVRRVLETRRRPRWRTESDPPPTSGASPRIASRKRST